MNFSMAFSTFVGQNIGANKLDRVRRGLVATIKMTSVISIILSMFAYFFGAELISLFTKEPEVIRIGAEYLLIVGLFYIAFSVMFSINAVFRGAGDTIVPMFITLFALWFVRIPLSYWLSSKIGVTGIWWGIPLAWIIGCIFACIYFFTGKWKSKAVVKHGG